MRRRCSSRTRRVLGNGHLARHRCPSPSGWPTPSHAQLPPAGNLERGRAIRAALGSAWRPQAVWARLRGLRTPRSPQIPLVQTAARGGASWVSAEAGRNAAATRTTPLVPFGTRARRALRRHRFPVESAVDVSGWLVALSFAAWLRYDLAASHLRLLSLGEFGSCAGLLQVVVGMMFGLYIGRWR